VTKRLVDVDDELLRAAQQAVGETTIKATVHRALELVVAQRDGREAELREQWETLGTALADLQDDTVMQRAWS